MMAKDTHAEVLAAAEAARAAFQTSAVAPSQGFPGALVRVPKKGAASLVSQSSLWDVATFTPGPVVPKPRRSSALRGKSKKAEEPTGPAPTLIQAALRAPLRPCPELERDARVPMAAREVILNQDGTFVVRVQVGDFSIYSRYVDGRRSQVTDVHAIMSVCPEAEGTSSMGCILVAPDGQRPGDDAVIERWLLQQDDRGSVWRSSNAQHVVRAASPATSYEDMIASASAWLAEKLKARPVRCDESDGFPRAQTRRRRA